MKAQIKKTFASNSHLLMSNDVRNGAMRVIRNYSKPEQLSLRGRGQKSLNCQVQFSDQLRVQNEVSEPNSADKNNSGQQIHSSLSHVIKIKKIHRIKPNLGKSMDRSPMVESIILSPSQQQKSSARSSNNHALLARKQHSFAGTVPLISQITSDKGCRTNSQEKKKEIFNSKIDEIDAENLPQNGRDTLAFQKKSSQAVKNDSQANKNDDESNRQIKNNEDLELNQNLQQYMIVESNDYGNYAAQNSQKLATEKSSVDQLSQKVVKQRVDPTRFSNPMNSQMITRTLIPSLHSTSQELNQSDQLSKKAVLSKNAKGFTSINMSKNDINEMNQIIDNCGAGNSIDSNKDGPLNDNSITENDHLNSKIKHTDKLRTENSNEDNLKIENNPLNDQFIVTQDASNQITLRTATLKSQLTQSKPNDKISTADAQTDTRKLFFQSDQMLLKIQEEQSLQKNNGNLRGRKLVNRNLTLWKQQLAKKNQSAAFSNQGGRRVPSQRQNQMAIISQNPQRKQKFVAIKQSLNNSHSLEGAGTKGSQDLIDQKLKQSLTSQIMKNVQEINNSLVTQVVQRPQTGQVNATCNFANKAAGARNLLKIGKNIQKVHIGTSKKQYLLMDSSASQLSNQNHQKSGNNLLQTDYQMFEAPNAAFTINEQNMLYDADSYAHQQEESSSISNLQIPRLNQELGDTKMSQQIEVAKKSLIADKKNWQQVMYTDGRIICRSNRIKKAQKRKSSMSNNVHMSKHQSQLFQRQTSDSKVNQLMTQRLTDPSFTNSVQFSNFKRKSSREQAAQQLIRVKFRETNSGSFQSNRLSQQLTKNVNQMCYNTMANFTPQRQVFLYNSQKDSSSPSQTRINQIFTYDTDKLNHSILKKSSSQDFKWLQENTTYSNDKRSFGKTIMQQTFDNNLNKQTYPFDYVVSGVEKVQQLSQYSPISSSQHNKPSILSNEQQHVKFDKNKQLHESLTPQIRKNSKIQTKIATQKLSGSHVIPNKDCIVDAPMSRQKNINQNKLNHFHQQQNHIVIQGENRNSGTIYNSGQSTIRQSKNRLEDSVYKLQSQAAAVIMNQRSHRNEQPVDQYTDQNEINKPQKTDDIQVNLKLTGLLNSQVADSAAYIYNDEKISTQIQSIESNQERLTSKLDQQINLNIYDGKQLTDLNTDQKLSQSLQNSTKHANQSGRKSIKVDELCEYDQDVNMSQSKQNQNNQPQIIQSLQGIASKSHNDAPNQFQNMNSQDLGSQANSKNVNMPLDSQEKTKQKLVNYQQAYLSNVTPEFLTQHNKSNNLASKTLSNIHHVPTKQATQQEINQKKVLEDYFTANYGGQQPQGSNRNQNPNLNNQNKNRGLISKFQSQNKVQNQKFQKSQRQQTVQKNSNSQMEQMGKYSTMRDMDQSSIVQYLDASQQISISDLLPPDRSKATTQTIQKGASNLDNSGQNQSIEYSNKGGWMQHNIYDEPNASNESALAQEANQFIGSVEQQTLQMTSASNEDKRTEGSSLDRIERVESQVQNNNSASVNNGASQEESSNNLKRRWILSRDKSKRYSATIIDKKNIHEKQSRIQQSRSKIENSNFIQRQNHMQTNSGAQNYQKTRILTESSQSYALQSRSDEIMVMGHKLTPTKKAERNESVTRSFSRSNGNSEKNRVSNVRKKHSNVSRHIIEQVKIESPNQIRNNANSLLLEQSKGRSYEMQNDQQQSKRAAQIVNTRNHQLIMEQPSSTSTLRNNQINQTASHEQLWLNQSTESQLHGNQKQKPVDYYMLQSNVFSQTEKLKYITPKQMRVCLTNGDSKQYLGNWRNWNEQARSRQVMGGDSKTLSKERIQNNYDFRFERIKKQYGPKIVQTSPSQQFYRHLLSRPKTSNQIGHRNKQYNNFQLNQNKLVPITMQEHYNNDSTSNQAQATKQMHFLQPIQNDKRIYDNQFKQLHPNQ